MSHISKVRRGILSLICIHVSLQQTLMLTKIFKLLNLELWYFICVYLQIYKIITQPSIYGVIVYFLLCLESLNYSTGQ